MRSVYTGERARKGCKLSSLGKRGEHLVLAAKETRTEGTMECAHTLEEKEEAWAQHLMKHGSFGWKAWATESKAWPLE